MVMCSRGHAAFGCAVRSHKRAFSTLAMRLATLRRCTRDEACPRGNINVHQSPWGGIALHLACEDVFLPTIEDPYPLVSPIGDIGKARTAGKLSRYGGCHRICR